VVYQCPPSEQSGWMFRHGCYEKINQNDTKQTKGEIKRTQVALVMNVFCSILLSTCLFRSFYLSVYSRRMISSFWGLFLSPPHTCTCIKCQPLKYRLHIQTCSYFFICISFSILCKAEQRKERTFKSVYSHLTRSTLCIHAVQQHA
jgi:hypothetical protein